MNIHLMVFAQIRDRTEQEVSALFRQTDLRFVGITMTLSTWRVAEAVPA